MILQINRNAPYVYGEENRIHYSEADAIVEGAAELATVPNLPVDAALQTISEFLVEQIPDGACI